MSTGKAGPHMPPPKSGVLRFAQYVLYICGLYFFIMGCFLAFFPGYIVTNIIQEDVSSIILGMLRGAGGATIPYGILYFLFAIKPKKHLWAGIVILTANILAVAIDIYAMAKGEYQFVHALMDLPFEVLSIVAIAIYYFLRVVPQNRPIKPHNVTGEEARDL